MNQAERVSGFEVYRCAYLEFCELEKMGEWGWGWGWGLQTFVSR
jgi:hypothetical protein